MRRAAAAVCAPDDKAQSAGGMPATRPTHQTALDAVGLDHDVGLLNGGRHFEG